MSKVSIKSTHFIQKLFSYINDERKLKLVIYNKTIQKIIDINLTNYKFMTRKYIVYESKGFAKEYDIYNDRLIYKGEYLNGKRNGKGEEYDFDGLNDKLIFSGEYLNGKRDGIGKEYYNDILIFEGEYLNGKKWNGKGYTRNGNILYELKDGSGLVKEYNIKDSIIFEGHYKNGEKNGRGIEHSAKYKNIIFIGEYYNGLRWNGKVFDENGNIVLELQSGKGIYQYYKNNKLSIKGEYLNGKLNGINYIYDDNGNLEIECEFIDGKKNGKFKEYNCSKLIFEGEYLYDHKKRGKEYTDNGILKYEGEYLFDQKWSGKGYDNEGNIIYELINGKGQIKEYDDKNNLIFEGEYLNGKKNRKGKEYKASKLIFEGEYLNNKIYNGKGKHIDYSLFLHYLIESEFEYKNFEKIKEKKYNKGKLIYDMECIDGKLNEKGYDGNGNLIYEIKNGNGIKKIYNFEGKLIFEGEYLNGKFNGKVKEFRGNSLRFEGEYLEGKKSKGKEYEEGKLVFEGEYLNGERWNGKGEEISFDGKLLFEGEYLNGKRWNGYGKEYDWFDTIEFAGEYINGEKKKLDIDLYL